jgi:hypothetical protein
MVTLFRHPTVRALYESLAGAEPDAAPPNAADDPVRPRRSAADRARRRAAVSGDVL